MRPSIHLAADANEVMRPHRQPTQPTLQDHLARGPRCLGAWEAVTKPSRRHLDRTGLFGRSGLIFPALRLCKRQVVLPSSSYRLAGAVFGIAGSVIKRPTMIRSRFLYISLVLALIGGAILLRYMDPFFVRALRLVAFDNFQRLAPEPYDPNLPIRIVDIDEKSLSMIGQWPWPRTTVRDLLLALTSKGAAVVAFDVLFAEPDRTSMEAIVKQLPPEKAKQ